MAVRVVQFHFIRGQLAGQAQELGALAVRVVAVNFEDFGNETPARTPFEMDHDVYGVSDVGLHGPIRDFHTALEHATREPGQALPATRGVHGRETSGMPRIEKLQEIEGFASPDFS